MVDADFGLQGFPARPEGVDRMAHYRTVLELVPEQVSTVWIRFMTCIY